MPRRARRTLALLAIACLPVMLWWLTQERHPPVSEVFPSGQLVVGIDLSYPPFGGLDADGQPVGLDIALAHALADRLGLSVTLVPLGYDGIYDAVTTGRVDLALGGTRVDPQRHGTDTRYTWGYFDNGLLLVSPPSRPLSDGQALTGQHLAVEYGSAAHAEARLWQRRVLGLTLELAPTSADALAWAQTGARNVTGALVETLTVLEGGAGWHTARLTSAPIAGVVDADRRAVLYHLNTALLTLLNSGDLDRLLERQFAP
jgi:ABC-type amino acid transport substrate-binding protein